MQMMQNALASKLSADNAMILHDTLKSGISRLAYRCSVVWQWPVDHLQSNANIRLHVSRALSLSKTFKNSERSMTVFQFSSFSFSFLSLSSNNHGVHFACLGEQFLGLLVQQHQGRRLFRENALAPQKTSERNESGNSSQRSGIIHHPFFGNFMNHSPVLCTQDSSYAL